MSKTQTLENKKGEVEFRKKLLEQIRSNNTYLSNQPTKEEYAVILKQRVHDSRSIFKKLEEKGINLSPFLEIGAERGQRSMLLVNEFNATGFMSDISYESLESAGNLKKTFGFKKIPFAVCCDAYNLPFKTGSIPFIFCFQTLHHFPDPKPILSEIKRVLAPGGYFYFNEEPIKQIFNLNLWRRDYHLRWFEKAMKKIGLLHFVSRIGKSETDHAILEEEFSLDTWEKALNIFEKADVNLKVFPFGPTIHRVKTKPKGWMNSFSFRKILLDILGGGIEVLCQKEESKRHPELVSGASSLGDEMLKPFGLAQGGQVQHDKLFNLLACPNCPNKSSLVQKEDKNLFCSTCKSTYKNRDHVYMLLTKKQENIMYS